MTPKATRKKSAAERERRAILRIVAKERRFYAAQQASNPQYEWERAIYVCESIAQAIRWRKR